MSKSPPWKEATALGVASLGLILLLVIVPCVLAVDPPDPSTGPPTKYQLVDRIVEDSRSLGHLIDRDNPDHNESLMRIIIGQNVAAIAYAAWPDGSPYHPQAAHGCEVLWEQWPEIAQDYPPCQR